MATPATDRRPAPDGERFSVPSAGRRTTRTVVRYVLLVVVAAIVLFPIWVTLVDSLLTSSRLVAGPPALFPTHPQWDDFRQAFDLANLGLYLRNSTIVCVAITAGTLATSILAAYAFTFMEFPFKRICFGLCVATLLVPAEVTIIPNVRTIDYFGWFNSYPALIVPFLASGLGIFLFRQSFRGLPRDLKDAATLDGYGHLRFLATVVVPLNVPMIGALGIYAFLSAWNQYLWPLLVTGNADRRTVTLGEKALVGINISDIDLAFAGTILAALPIFVILIVFQKTLVRGLTAGALKG